MNQDKIHAKYFEYKSKVLGYSKKEFPKLGEDIVLDLYHDSLMAIWILCKKDNRIELTENFYPLVKTIFRRKAINNIRKDRGDDNMKQWLSFQIDQTVEVNASKALLAQCQKEMFLEHFRNISASCQKILDLRFQGHSWKEIAKIKSSINIDTAANRFKEQGNRCKKRLMVKIRSDKSCDQYNQ